MSDPRRLRLDQLLSTSVMDSQISPEFRASVNGNRQTNGSGHRRRFECTYAGCGRHYSRNEHLVRHQLNHNPKEIYKCDYPGCSRTFVRVDLCIRHRRRHGDSGRSPSGEEDHAQEPLSPRSSLDEDMGMSPTSPTANIFATPNPLSNTRRPSFPNRTSFSGEARKSSDGQPTTQQQSRAESNGTTHHIVSQQYASDLRPSASANSMDYTQSSLVSETPLSLQRSHSLSDQVFDTFDTSVLTQVRTHSNASAAPGANDQQLQDTAPTTFGVPNGSDQQMQAHTPNAFSVTNLGDQAFNNSPVSSRDEFTAWLFEDSGGLQTGPFSFGGQGGIGFAASASDGFGNAIYNNYFADPTLDTGFPNMAPPRPPEPMSKALEVSGDGNLLSHAKRKALIELMEYRFNEGDNAFVRQLREEIFQGNVNAEDHVLSSRSMQHYIGSYWYHFHAQMPILHQPTFSADDTHEYLLLAIMVIGAAYLNKAHGRTVTDAAARLATFIAWHLRWQVFMHNDFHPPAKLWVFQTLLLLEIYEKMNATRMLHERAHIHYATTINLMRRGTALIETSSQETSSRMPSSPKEWWSRWITAEATRRAAYAAFYLDAVHATMFGHAAMMVVHEVRLPLPCDDALWSATSAAEVGRVEASLHANGIKPTTFVDGLKKILTGRKVRTNNFGRMILMAGLLSVSWHMHQRDLQVSSLGVSQTMGAPEDWRSPLTKAFDFWKRDFDETLEHMRRAALPWQKNDAVAASGDEDLATTANVLHHLSHMAMHVDIMDCQVFAGIKKLFGRTVSNSDYDKVKCKIFDWAKGPRAKIGVYHALQLLKSVILPAAKDGSLSTSTSSYSRKLYNARDDHLMIRPWAVYFAALVVWSYGFAVDGVLRPFPNLMQQSNSAAAAAAAAPGGAAASSASPGAMSVMSHGSTHSSVVAPLPPPPHLTYDGSEPPLDMDAVIKDAHGFLQTVGAAKSPQQLESIKDGSSSSSGGGGGGGRNNVVGVLVILEMAFHDSRWELLHEAAELLRNAILLLRGANRS